MLTEDSLHDDVQALISDFHQRLIELISAKRSGEHTSKSLPELYALATKLCPRLHQDQTLCELHMKLLNKSTRENETSPVIFSGINAWIEAGMSPIIYFSKSVPGEDVRASITFLERLNAARQMLLSREELLGNLSLEQFSHFLADRVAMHRMSYRWLCKLVRVMPELIAPTNWKNLQYGHIKVHAKVKKRQIESTVCLKSFVPLLLVESGRSKAWYRKAKNELGLHDPQSMEHVTRNAFAISTDEHHQAVLERFIQFEYGGWDTPRLDNALTHYLHHYSFHTRHSYFELGERFWFVKAAETLCKPDHGSVTWPAALYGNFLNLCRRADDFEGRGIFRWKTLLRVIPELRVIQNYVIRVNTPLIAVLKDTLECALLADPIFLSQFEDEVKNAYALVAAPLVARHMMKKMSYGVFERFETPEATERTLQRLDPVCVIAMSEWAKHSKNIRELDCRLQGHRSILWLMIRNLQGEDNKDEAVAWCTRRRAQRTKLEAMRLLHLTLDDVRLSPGLHDEFLSRDLGL